jgi:hypothetical protein
MDDMTKTAKGEIVILRASLLPDGRLNIRTAGDEFIQHDQWGEIVATIIRHIGKAGERMGNPINLTISQVLKHMDGELDSPTATPAEDAP